MTSSDGQAECLLVEPVSPARRSDGVVRATVKTMKPAGFGGNDLIAQTLARAGWRPAGGKDGTCAEPLKGGCYLLRSNPYGFRPLRGSEPSGGSLYTSLPDGGRIRSS